MVDEKIAFVANRAVQDRPVRITFDRVGSLKRGEVMLANEAGSRLIHRVMVEQIGNMPGIARPDWRAPRVVPDPVLIDATRGVAARIKGVRDLFNPCDGNIDGKNTVQATLKT